MIVLYVHMQTYRYLYTVIYAKGSVFLSLSQIRPHAHKHTHTNQMLHKRLSLSLSPSNQTSRTHTHTHTNQMSQYVSLLYCTRTHWLMMECILSCRRAARHTCKHVSKTVAVSRRIQVHMSMWTHVHAYVGRVCDERGLFLRHRLAHMHMYVFGAEKGVCKYVVDATVFDLYILILMKQDTAFIQKARTK